MRRVGDNRFGCGRGVCRNLVGALKADWIPTVTSRGAYKLQCHMEQPLIVRVFKAQSWHLVQKFLLENRRTSQLQQIQHMNSTFLNQTYLSLVPTIAWFTSGKASLRSNVSSMSAYCIASRATGICGSDVHFWKHGNIGDSVITKDCGLGHESSGIVVKVGKNVKTFDIGMLIVQLAFIMALFIETELRTCSTLCFSQHVYARLLTSDRRPCCSRVRHPVLPTRL
jgi:hypothetical protein